MSAANHHHLHEHTATDCSDSDSADLESSYRPISFNSDTDSDPDNEFPIHSNGGWIRNADNHRQQNPNPNVVSFSSLDLNGTIDEEAGEIEIERGREASILRAFREDESRRSAPLTAENSSRVMDAMRGVRFVGSAPEWADQVPEDRWVDRLGRLRGESTAATSSS